MNQLSANRKPEVYMEKAGKSWGFRPRGKTLERLTYAEKIGLNCSALVNKVLDGHLRDYLEKDIAAQRTELEKRKIELESALKMPVP